MRKHGYLIGLTIFLILLDIGIGVVLFSKGTEVNFSHVAFLVFACVWFAPYPINFYAYCRWVSRNVPKELIALNFMLWAIRKEYVAPFVIPLAIGPALSIGYIHYFKADLKCEKDLNRVREYEEENQ